MELAELIALLGLDESATKAQVLDALKKLMEDKADADAKVAALKAAPPKAPKAEVDLSQYVPLAVVTEMQSQLAALSAQVQTGGLDQLITDAKKEGRLLPAMEGWARDLGKKDIAALKSYLDQAQPVAALSAMQTSVVKSPVSDHQSALTAAEKEAARISGMTEKDYAALKAKI